MGAPWLAPRLQRRQDGGVVLLDPHNSSEASPRRRSITASRSERQFTVASSDVDLVADQISGHIAATIQQGAVVSTVYFDDAERRHLEACRQRGHSDRLRLREYPAPWDGGGRAYFVERKQHLGHLTEKARRRVTPAEAAALMANRRWAAAAFALLEPGLGAAPLEPVLVVQYRRQTFAAADCRVTIDRSVTFFTPPGAASLPLVDRPGEMLLTEPDATLEVKHTGAPPAWLAALCERLTPQPSSKFLRGCQALSAHGPLAIAP